jgi:SWI/SNF-related matrix-associated actin-dependent regulator 1 of chromatin subfamily A
LSLYPFQKDAVAFVAKASGRCILGDEMGLGKTVEALAWAKQQPDIKRVLIVTPASVLYKWQDECYRWWGKPNEVIVTSKDPIGLCPVSILTYGILTRRVVELSTIPWDLLILDEFHYIKGHKSKRTIASQAVARVAKYVLLLSGTPMLNRPMELFNGLNIIDRKVWANPFAFGHRYAGGLTERGWFKGSTNEEELHRRLQPYMIRRLKTEVLEQLPELQRIHVPVDIPNMDEYKQVRSQVRAALKELDPNHKGYFVNALDKLNALRRVVGIGKTRVAVEWAEEFLEQTESKLVIFVHHKENLDTLQKVLNERYGAYTISGEVSAQSRANRVQAFQHPGRPRVLIVTTAGGEGIDLFGLEGVDASTLLLVERQWNPAREEQMEARLHRLGQHNAVNAYYLSARRTVDDKFYHLVEAKRETLKRIIGADIPTTLVKDLLESLERET